MAGQRFSREFLIAALCILLAGCAGTYALRADNSVGLDFWRGVIKPDLNYFSFSPAREPEVIIGVNRNLVLVNSVMWQPVSPLTPENISTISQMMFYRWQIQNIQVQGYRMVDDKGRYVGEWYSPENFTTEIYSRGGNRVYISPPSPTATSSFTVPWGGLQPGQY